EAVGRAYSELRAGHGALRTGHGVRVSGLVMACIRAGHGALRTGHGARPAQPYSRSLAPPDDAGIQQILKALPKEFLATMGGMADLGHLQPAGGYAPVPDVPHR